MKHDIVDDMFDSMSIVGVEYMIMARYTYKDGELIGTVVNCNTYRVLGEVVGNAFKDGLKLKD